MAILAKDGGETLSEHTLRCLKVADVLLQNLPFGESTVEELTNDLHLALAVHDVGKAATGFQKSLQKNAKRWGHRHEIISAAFATSLGFKAEIILAIITHHKSLPSDGISSEKGCLPREEIPFAGDLTSLWNEMSEEWKQNIPAFTKEWNTICNAIDRTDLANSMKLTPLLIDKKWLKRNKQCKRIPFEKRYYASLLRGLLISSDHIASNNSVNPNFMPAKIPILTHFDLITPQNTLRGFQRRSSEHLGHLILRAPTGSGKTLVVSALDTAKSKDKWKVILCSS